MYTYDRMAYLYNYYRLMSHHEYLRKAPDCCSDYISGHAWLDRLDKRAGIDTKGFFQQPHSGAYTVEMRIRMHEQHIQKPCQTYFWLGAEGGAYVPDIGRYSG